MTPSRIGRTTWMPSGVLPIISLAFCPTAATRRMPLTHFNRRFVQDDASAAHVNDRVHGAQVDSQILG